MSEEMEDSLDGNLAKEDEESNNNLILPAKAPPAKWAFPKDFSSFQTYKMTTMIWTTKMKRMHIRLSCKFVLIYSFEFSLSN
jgi:hypothetical protein